MKKSGLCSRLVKASLVLLVIGSISTNDASASPTGNITGKVLWQSDSLPVSGAAVITSSGGSAITDASGNYTITGVSEGNCSVMASVVGWRSSNPQSVTVIYDSTAVAPDLYINNTRETNRHLQYSIYRTDTAPVIDGVPGTPEWVDANTLHPFYVFMSNDTQAYPQTAVRALYDDSNLYIAYEVEEPDMAHLVANATGHDATSPNIFSDDGVELYIDPLHKHNGPDGLESAYAFVVNTRPAPDTAYGDRMTRTGFTDSTWDPAGIQVAATRGADRYFIEMKIPFTSIPGLTGVPAAGQVMGMLFGRHRVSNKTPAGNDWTQSNYWVPAGLNWTYGINYNDVTFAGYKPVNVCSPNGFVRGGRWNLVSVPADPVNPDPLAVFSGIDVTNASLQFWKNHSEAGGYQSYGSLFGWTGPVERGIPYWFLEPTETASKQICFACSPAAADFEMSIPARQNAPFWVMFGMPFPDALPADSIQFKNIVKRGDTWLSWANAFSESDPAQRIVDSNAQGWSAAENRFVTVTPSAFTGESQTLTPWWGYWLLVCDTSELKIRFPKP